MHSSPSALVCNGYSGLLVFNGFYRSRCSRRLHHTLFGMDTGHDYCCGRSVDIAVLLMFPFFLRGEMMTSFKLKDFLAYLQSTIERASIHMAELGITEATYVSLANDMSERDCYLSTLPNQFPWKAEKVECWSVDIYKRKASCRAEFVIEDPKGSMAFRIGTDLPFDNIPKVKEIPATILEYIVSEIRKDLANVETANRGDRPEKLEWRRNDPDLVRARRDLGVIEHHMKLRRQ